MFCLRSSQKLEELQRMTAEAMAKPASAAAKEAAASGVRRLSHFVALVGCLGSLCSDGARPFPCVAVLVGGLASFASGAALAF